MSNTDHILREILDRLSDLELRDTHRRNQLILLQRQGHRIMTLAQDIKTLISQVDAATTAIAIRIQALVDRIGTGISNEEAAEIKASLQSEVDTLTSLGQDPTNPIP